MMINSEMNRCLLLTKLRGARFLLFMLLPSSENLDRVVQLPFSAVTVNTDFKGCANKKFVIVYVIL